MKIKNIILFCLLMVIGFVIIPVNSCKKEEDNIIKDLDGNVYTSVIIGTQVWMVENLKTTRFSNGDVIETTHPSRLDISAEVSPEYQWAPNGDESNIARYGRLYTGYVANDSRNVCPTGWHVPTDDEWMTLSEYLGGSAFAGGKLKEAGTTHWASPNAGATNESGFTALPSGGRPNSFCCLGNYGYYWCSYQGGSGEWVYGLLWELFYSDSETGHESNPLYSGWSIRCLKDK
jgi:uncharacterized protein (TIGR02145 family)